MAIIAIMAMEPNAPMKDLLENSFFMCSISGLLQKICVKLQNVGQIALFVVLKMVWHSFS